MFFIMPVCVLKEGFMQGSFTAQNWQIGAGVEHRQVFTVGDCVPAVSNQVMTVFWHGDRPIGHHAPWSATIPESLMTNGFNKQSSQVCGETRQQAAAASVVICTRDRANDLQRCLAALASQTVTPRQVIVVDNASVDQHVKQIVTAAGADYIREERPGLDRARNEGLRMATGDIVVFVDDDVVVHRNWLQGLVAAFDRPAIAVVTGLVLPAELTTEAQCHFEEFWGFGRGYRRLDFDTGRFQAAHDTVFPVWEIGAGASMALRREACLEVGLFDERLDVGEAGCSGDSELWYRLLAYGYTCRYEPAAVAFHFHRRTMTELSSQIYAYMRGHAAALLVQHERTGISANRRRAWIDMPRWYGWRAWRRVRQGPTRRDRFLREEITGYLSGLFFYYRQRRTDGRQ